MTTIDLREFDDDGFVLHFGGRTHEVDALTFGNALVSLASDIRSAEIIEGATWHTGDGHTREQTCVSEIDVEVKY